MAKIYVVFYSTYGHVYKLAEKVKEGIDSVEGVEGVLFQVAETLSEPELEALHAPPKPDVPVITADRLPEADGFAFGFASRTLPGAESSFPRRGPDRFGNAPAQFRAFWDSTGKLWMAGALVGKPATIFTSTGSQGGGTESSILSALPPLFHQGLIYVPPGYTYGPKFYDNSEVRGGSPLGASTFAGLDGSRQPTEIELDFARHQGAHIAGVVKKLAAYGAS